MVGGSLGYSRLLPLKLVATILSERLLWGILEKVPYVVTALIQIIFYNITLVLFESEMKFEYNYQIILNEHNRQNRSNSKYLKDTLKTYMLFLFSYIYSSNCNNSIISCL